jgi:hypothetical protein
MKDPHSELRPWVFRHNVGAEMRGLDPRRIMPDEFPDNWGNDLLRTPENNPAFGQYESTVEESSAASFLGIEHNSLLSISATKRR